MEGGKTNLEVDPGLTSENGLDTSIMENGKEGGREGGREDIPRSRPRARPPGTS